MLVWSDSPAQNTPGAVQMLPVVAEATAAETATMTAAVFMVMVGRLRVAAGVPRTSE
jgi:hypothetical protein